MVATLSLFHDQWLCDTDGDIELLSQNIMIIRGKVLIALSIAKLFK